MPPWLSKQEIRLAPDPLPADRGHYGFGAYRVKGLLPVLGFYVRGLPIRWCAEADEARSRKTRRLAVPRRHCNLSLAVRMLRPCQLASSFASHSRQT